MYHNGRTCSSKSAHGYVFATVTMRPNFALFLYELTLVKYVVCGSVKEMFYTKDFPKDYRLLKQECLR